MSAPPPTADNPAGRYPSGASEQLRLFPDTAGAADSHRGVPCRIDGCPACARRWGAINCCVGLSTASPEAEP